MKALPQKITTAASLIAITCLTSFSFAQGERRSEQGTSQNLNEAVDPVSNAPASDITKDVLTASIDVKNHTLRRWAGKNLLNHEGAELGTIRDFIVHPSSGRVRYVVVSSGGFLGGMGNSLRLVPIEVLRRTTRGAGVEVEILQAAWLQSPPVSDENYVIDRFEISPAQHQEMINRFGAPGGAGRTGAMLSRTEPLQGDVSGLIRASVLRGKAVRAEDRKVGNIENIIIDLERGTAAALLDASGDFTGTTAKYVIPLNRLAFDNSRQDPIGTSLTRADFDRARPANFGGTQNMASVQPGTVDESSLAPTGRTNSSPATVPSSDTLAASARIVRRAINEDPMLVTEKVQVAPESGKIVLSGTVKTEAMRSSIESVARRALPSGNIENQIRVENR